MNQKDKTIVRNSLIRLAKSGVKLMQDNGVQELCELVGMSPQAYAGHVDDRHPSVKAVSGSQFD